MTWLLTLAFDGTEYCGFQVQPNGRSVAAAFQDGLEAVLGCRPDIKGCSRTDAGVHALGFVLSFEAETRIPPEKLPLALNTKLPRDIRVLKAQRVPDGFHARYAAHTKTYLYRIHNSPIDSPFEERYYCRIPGRLEVERMQRAAAHFVGTHDFLALCAAHSSAAAHGDTVRTITACTVARSGEDIAITPDGPRGPAYRFNPGTALLAQITHCTIVMVPSKFHCALRLKTWDGFYIPLPFSRVDINPKFIPYDKMWAHISAKTLAEEFRETLTALTED